MCIFLLRRMITNMNVKPVYIGATPAKIPFHHPILGEAVSRASGRLTYRASKRTGDRSSDEFI